MSYFSDTYHRVIGNKQTNIGLRYTFFFFRKNNISEKKSIKGKSYCHDDNS